MEGRSSHFRAHVRVPVSLSAALRLGDSEEERPARVTNLSLSGACVELSGAPAVGGRVRLELRLPHLWQPWRIEAEVRWRHVGRPERAGVRFRFEDNATLLTLLEFFESVQNVP
jgi:hypothetical protein